MTFRDGWCMRGLGLCHAFYHFRFVHNDANAERKLRSDISYFTLAALGYVSFPVWGLIELVLFVLQVAICHLSDSLKNIEKTINALLYAPIALLLAMLEIIAGLTVGLVAWFLPAVLVIYPLYVLKFFRSPLRRPLDE